jgi:hypothetical protein
MKNLIPFLIILFATPTFANDMMVTVNVNRLCAAIVGIPYASDNFTDAEWEQFKRCLQFVRQFDGVE